MLPLDWLIVGVYLAALCAVGIVATRRVKSTGEYFLGGRGFGRLLMVAQSFGVSTHAEMPVSLAGAVYSMGISAIWYQWKNLFAMPFYWIMAPVFRRVRRTTSAEVMEDRYGAGMGLLYVLFAFVFFVIALASVLKGGAKILSEVLGGGFSVNQVVVALAAVFVLYSFTGGLVASTWSNFLQGLLIIVFSVMLIPLGWNLVGGFKGMRLALPGYFFSMTTPRQIGPWFIAMLTLNGLIGIMAQPHMIAAVGTGKDEYACRVGFLHGTFMKRLCTIGWAIVGLMVAALVAKTVFGISRLSDPEEAFGFACRHLLTPGFRGLLFAGVMGASLACCSALMIDSGALFTQGFYRPRLAPGHSDRHYLWVGRVSGVAAVLLAVIYAVSFIQKVLYSFLLMETIATYMGISLVGGIVWRRANRWGAGGSVIVALTANFGLYHMRNERLDYWDPNIFLIALLSGIATLIFVSLLTPAERWPAVTRFFTNLETPSDLHVNSLDGESTKDATLAEDSHGTVDPNRWAAEHGRQLLFVNLLQLRRGAQGLGFVRAYRDDLKGLLMGAGLCATLVITMWVILRL
jgi:Na+/proline symporter